MTSGGQGTDVYYCDASTNNVVWRTKATQYANPKSYAGKAEVPNSNCNVAAGTFSFQVNFTDVTGNSPALETAVNDGADFSLAWATSNDASRTTMSYHGGTRGGVSGISLKVSPGPGVVSQPRRRRFLRVCGRSMPSPPRVPNSGWSVRTICARCMRVASVIARAGSARRME